MKDNKVNWHETGNPDIVTKPAKGVAAYLSALGYLVIRQEGEESDAEILINPENIETFAIRISNLAGLSE